MTSTPHEIGRLVALQEVSMVEHRLTSILSRIGQLPGVERHASPQGLVIVKEGVKETCMAPLDKPAIWCRAVGDWGRFGGMVNHAAAGRWLKEELMAADLLVAASGVGGSVVGAATPSSPMRSERNRRIGRGTMRCPRLSSFLIV